MTASPAQWAARLILVAALGVTGFYLLVDPHGGPAPPPYKAPPPLPAPAASPSAGDASPAGPAQHYGASFPIPGEAADQPAPSPAAAPAPRPAPAATATATPDDGYRIKRILDTGGPIRYGDWFWDEQGIPAGRVIITVDLKANVLSIFRDGYEIGTAAVIYGADEKPTPLGVFPILQKDAKHVSNLYDAPMPYMLRLTNDGVAIHGSRVAYDAATHGCVGIPLAFAKKLFGAVRLGDKVIVTRGEMLNTGQAVNALR